MAISNIVLRSGVGPTATIPLFVTHGLAIGSISATDTVGDSRSHYTYSDRKLSREYELAKQREELKQQEVIDMRLKAQDALVQIRDAKSQSGKAARNRISALENEYNILLEEIAAQMAALEQMRLQTLKARNNLIYLLLAASQPFSQITIH